jgi:hypothetical protein
MTFSGLPRLFVISAKGDGAIAIAIAKLDASSNLFAAGVEVRAYLKKDQQRFAVLSNDALLTDTCVPFGFCM